MKGKKILIVTVAMGSAGLQVKKIFFGSVFVSVVFLLIISGCKKKRPSPNDPPLSSEKIITSFTFFAVDNTDLGADVTGVIGQDTITVTLNQGTNISNMVPFITYTGKTLSPGSGITQNFNNTIQYTVTAEDGSTKKYTVKIIFKRANLKIYVGSDDGRLYALNANTGGLLWKYTTGGAIQSSPTLANNIVYVGSFDKNLYAIDASTGALKWKYLTSAPIRSESPVVSNGTVFISSTNAYPDGVLYALDATTGSLKWSKSISVPTSPTVSNGKVFVCAFGGSFYALNETNGNTVWSGVISLTRSNSAINNDKLYIEGSSLIRCVDPNNGSILWGTACLASLSGPTIDNGTVYLSSSTGTLQYLEAFNATNGSVKWRYSLTQAGNSNSPVTSCPVILDNLAYPGFHYGPFCAVNTANGVFAWQFGSATQSGVWFANPSAANAVVYVGSNDSNVYALDAVTGVMKWKYLTGGAVYSGPCIVDSDGAFFHAGPSGSKN